jgi:hypothetical protein
MRREGQLYQSFRDATAQYNLPEFARWLDAETGSNNSILQLLDEIFQREEPRSAEPLLNALENSENLSLETNFRNALDDQLAGVFLTILKWYPTTNCGIECPDQAACNLRASCGFWMDRMVFDRLTGCLKDSERFSDIFLRIMQLGGEEERILCLILFYTREDGDEIVNLALSVYRESANDIWRLVLKLFSFMISQVAQPCHISDLEEVVNDILVSKELGEYFCAFIYYVQKERPNWYEHKKFSDYQEWFCKDCRTISLMRRYDYL